MLRYLDALRTVIDGAGDEAKYPDGVLGAVFAAMLAIERHARTPETSLTSSNNSKRPHDSPERPALDSRAEARRHMT